MRIGSWFATFDPGRIRLEQVIKGGLAMVTAMALMWAVMTSLARVLDIAPVIFSFMIVFVSFMAVNEVLTAARKRTLLLSAFFYLAAPFIVGIVQPYPLIAAILLLAVMFVSFYGRRYGVRAAELGLAAVFAYYFSALFGATLATALWYVIGAAVGIASAYVWQFAILHYEPQRFLRQAIAAFDSAVAAAVGAIAADFAATAPTDQIKSAIKRVRAARKAVELQLPGVAGAAEWAGARSQQLRMHLFTVEQDLQDLAAAGVLARQHSEAPAVAKDSLAQTLAALQAFLVQPYAPERMEALAAAGKQVSEQAQVAPGGDTRNVALAGLRSASLRIARAMQGLADLLAQPAAPAADLAVQRPALAPKTTANAAPAPPQRGLHPTSVLGIQAVLACGLAMMVSFVFDLDRPYWAFWTAFIVVAGPAGESLQKLLFRVVGVALGAAFGTLLVVLLPDNLALLVALQILALILGLYTRVINYAWMVFWITTFVALLYNVEGVPAQTLLIERPLNTLVGATIAALVVLFVMPIREQGKFAKTLAGFLKAIDGYLTAIADNLGLPATPAVAAAAMQAGGSFEAVAQTFPALALETNPLAHLQGETTAQATIVSDLYAEVSHFAALVTDGAQEMEKETAAQIQNRAATIHDNLIALEQIAGGRPAPLQQLPGMQLDETGASATAWPELFAGDTGSSVGLLARRSLDQINQMLMQLGEIVISA